MHKEQSLLPGRGRHLRKQLQAEGEALLERIGCGPLDGGEVGVLGLKGRKRCKGQRGNQ